MKLIADSAITKLHFNRRLRGILLSEIVLIFLFYLLLFLVVTALVSRQETMTRRIVSRLNLGGDIQTIERLELERENHVHAFLINNDPSNIDRVKASDKELERLLLVTQKKLSSLSVQEAANADQEMYALGRIEELNVQQHASIEQLIPEIFENSAQDLDQATQRDLEMNLFEQQQISLSYLEGWRTLVHNDIARLNDILARYRQISLAALSIQALLVVVSLIIIAYTYVSPAFEKLLKKVVHQNAQLRELDMLKNEFVSIVSHQLKTPLSELKWNLALLRRERKRPTPREQELLLETKTSTDTMIRLVVNLLDVSRIEQGKLEFHPIKTDILPIIRAIIRETRAEAKKKNIHLALTCTVNKSELMVDPLLLRHCLQNLVDNAVKYNKTDGKVAIDLSQEKQKVIIKVIDTGYGIAAQDLSFMFTKFFRSVDAMKMHPDGSGLGLYFAKKIIERHNGQIKVSSKVGTGTTFSIILPRS